MKTIYKYPIELTDTQAVQLPSGAQILAVQVQAGTPCIWAMVKTECPPEKRHFEIFGTGHPMNEDVGVDRKYIGTFQMHEGALVLHLFERVL